MEQLHVYVFEIILVFCFVYIFRVIVSYSILLSFKMYSYTVCVL